MPSRLGAVELSQPTIQADRKKRDDDAVQGVVQRLTRGDLRSSRISVRPSLLPFAHRPVMPYAAVVSGSFGRTDWARKMRTKAASSLLPALDPCLVFCP